MAHIHLIQNIDILNTTEAASATPVTICGQCHPARCPARTARVHPAPPWRRILQEPSETRTSAPLQQDLWKLAGQSFQKTENPDVRRSGSEVAALPGIVVDGSNSAQLRNLLTIELSEFRKLRHEGADSDRAAAGMAKTPEDSEHTSVTENGKGGSGLFL